MNRAPVITHFRGEPLNQCELSSKYRIAYGTLSNWRRAGILIEDVIEEYLRERELKCKAAEHGVSVRLLRDRIADGWDEERAATTPPMNKGRRARAHA